MLKVKLHEASPYPEEISNDEWDRLMAQDIKYGEQCKKIQVSIKVRTKEILEYVNDACSGATLGMIMNGDRKEYPAFLSSLDSRLQEIVGMIRRHRAGIQ